MNLSHTIYAIRWLVRDTFRQARASGIAWLMFGITGVCTLFCLSIGFDGDVSLRQRGTNPDFLSRHDFQANDWERLEMSGVDVVSGELTLVFGSVRMELGRDREDAIRHVQLLLAGGVADTVGVLFALIWTGGFLPGFLGPGAISVLLAKPVPRWSLLVGKFLGVLAFVGFQAIAFVGCTWLALALRTDCWDAVYLITIPILLIHFAVFFSFSMLLAVTMRSTVACVFGSIVFWLVCWGMNAGRHAVAVFTDWQSAAPAYHGLIEAGYWILPKPADFNGILFHALGAENHFSSLLPLQQMESQGLFLPELSVLTSFAFMLIVLALAAREFVTQDY